MWGRCVGDFELGACGLLAPWKGLDALEAISLVRLCLQRDLLGPGFMGTSLVAQWLTLHTLNAILGQGTRSCVC